MTLSPQIIETLRSYCAKLASTVQFKLFDGQHPKRQELVELLQTVASLSDKVELIYSETGFNVREGLTFEILRDGVSTGIRFSGIPGGHEFNSFVLAFLQAGGIDIKLDANLQAQARAIDEPLSFEVFISLDCHNCPDVVQTLNQFSLLNPLISCEMIDGASHQSLAEERAVQGVPTVFLDRKPFSSGKISAGEILDKIRQSIDIGPVELVSDDTRYDVAVIGGGPAAAAAAIYTARKGLSVLMLAEKLGGQVAETMGIENLIGTVKTTGPELTRNLRAHVEAYPITIREEVRVAGIARPEEASDWQLSLATGETLNAKTAIVATGAKWRQLGVPGEAEYIGKGVAYCPHCDGPFFKGKDVVVVGGGNSGVEAALDLAGIVQSVTVVEFMENLKADQVLVDQLRRTKNATIVTNAATERIESDGRKVTGLSLKDRSSGATRLLPADGVFIQIGLAPNSAFLKDAVELTAHGEVVVNARCETSQPGLFACGDVTTVPYKQIVVSMGEGAKAGLSAFEYLLKSSNVPR